MKEQGYVKGEFKFSRLRRARLWWERNSGYVVGAAVVIAAVGTHKRLSAIEEVLQTSTSAILNHKVWLDAHETELYNVVNDLDDIHMALEKLSSKKK